MELKPFPPDFKDFIEILNQRKVKYMVIGGWALGLHGWPRLTKDLDVWISVDPENRSIVRMALHEFGAPGTLGDDFFSDSEKNVFFMGRSPNRIEVISSVDGVTFDQCYENSVIVEHGEIEVRVIGLADFKTNKRESGRLQDLADLENLGES